MVSSRLEIISLVPHSIALKPRTFSTSHSGGTPCCWCQAKFGGDWLDYLGEGRCLLVEPGPSLAANNAPATREHYRTPSSSTWRSCGISSRWQGLNSISDRLKHYCFASELTLSWKDRPLTCPECAFSNMRFEVSVKEDREPERQRKTFLFSTRNLSFVEWAIVDTCALLKKNCDGCSTKLCQIVLKLRVTATFSQFDKISHYIFHSAAVAGRVMCRPSARYVKL